MGSAFERVLEMVRGVRALGLEACCTLGMLTAAQAEKLKRRRLDRLATTTSIPRPLFMGQIISTRTYRDRLETLERVRRGRNHRLFWRDHWLGGERRRPGSHASNASQPETPTRERAHQHAGSGGGHAPRRTSAARSAGSGPLYCNGARSHAAFHGASVGWSNIAEPGWHAAAPVSWPAPIPSSMARSSSLTPNPEVEYRRQAAGRLGGCAECGLSLRLKLRPLDFRLTGQLAVEAQ